MDRSYRPARSPAVLPYGPGLRRSAVRARRVRGTVHSDPGRRPAARNGTGPPPGKTELGAGRLVVGHQPRSVVGVARGQGLDQQRLPHQWPAAARVTPQLPEARSRPARSWRTTPRPRTTIGAAPTFPKGPTDAAPTRSPAALAAQHISEPFNSAGPNLRPPVPSSRSGIRPEPNAVVTAHHRVSGDRRRSHSQPRHAVVGRVAPASGSRRQRTHSRSPHCPCVTARAASRSIRSATRRPRSARDFPFPYRPPCGNPK